MTRIRQCTMDDLQMLQQISQETFFKAFAHLNSPEDMRRHAEEKYTLDALQSELEKEGSRFYFVYEENALAGYMKLNVCPDQSDLHDEESLELERIYVLPGFQNKGIGDKLIAHAEDVARALGKTRLWLGVWEDNTRALHFYERHGLEAFGAHPYILGDDRQTDILMHKAL